MFFYLMRKFVGKNLHESPDKVSVGAYQAHMSRVTIVSVMCPSSVPYLPELPRGPEAIKRFSNEACPGFETYPLTLIIRPSHRLLTARSQNSSTAVLPSSLSQLSTWSNLAVPGWSVCTGGKWVRSRFLLPRKGSWRRDCH